MPLYDLIQSMSKSEKRYFKLYAQIGKKSPPKYTLLFDLINKQETYDEQKIKAKGFTSDDKNLLTEKMLDAIHNMQLHKTVDSELRLILDYFSILFNKKQWHLLDKYIKKGKQIATENERFDILLHILKWENRLLLRTEKTNFDEKINDIIRQKSELLEQLKDQVQYYDLSTGVDVLLIGDALFNKPETHKRFNEIMSLPLLDPDAKPLSKRAMLDYCYIRFLYHRKKKEDEEVLHYFRLLIELFNENKFLLHVQDYSVFYIKVYFWEKSLSLKLDKVSNTPALQLSDFPKGAIDLNYTINLQNLTYCIRSLDKVEGERYILEAEQHWEKYTQSIKETRLSIFSYTIMMFYCLFEDWEKAQIWLDKITCIHRVADRKDIQIAARLWQLMICYERTPFDLDKHIQSAYKYFVRNEHYFEVEEQILQLFRDLYKAITQQEKVVVWQKMSDFIAGKLNEEVASQRGLVNLQIWCQSKIARISNLQVMRQRQAEEALMYV